ncbi:MAG: hypothetical protein A2Y17_06730 [Clostridiales bacterium GWF2_38_85]|nr:MAG: hypothetical protein A2Y17_06730 [Clostridiales bacterium GWF2_38_85]
MKLALLADIHGNFTALEECLNYIDTNNYDGLVFLGDYISDCLYPQKTLELLKTRTQGYKTWFIRGNREDYIINYHNSNNKKWRYASSTGAVLYTYENLTEADIKTFESMPICMNISIDYYPPITICHGSPVKSNEWICGKDELMKKYLDSIDADYLFCGHTHRYHKYVFENKEIVFVGSVGLPTNRQTNAQFVSLEYINNKWQDELISIPYDREKLIHEFKKSEILKKSLVWGNSIIALIKTGTDMPMQCVRRAYQIASEDRCFMEDGIIPEIYWKKAAEELNLYDIIEEIV